MDPIVVALIAKLTEKVVEIIANWNDPAYEPVGADELEAMAKELESLPNLPTK